MRICKNCNVNMMEHNRVYMTSWVSGSATAYGSAIKIEYKPTFFQKKMGFIADTLARYNLNTAICPCCGLVETYLNHDDLERVKEFIDTHKN